MKKTLITILILTATLTGIVCSPDNPRILIKTDLGDITAELYLDKAPVTAGNFLRYAQEGRVEDGSFYRVVTINNQPNDRIRIEVIQGGLLSWDHPDALPPIVHETTDQTGILHKDGVLSMARAKTGTATHHFFICVGDQPELDFGGKRNPDGQGFATFGKVIQGMDVVRAIHTRPADGQMLLNRVKIHEIQILD